MNTFILGSVLVAAMIPAQGQPLPTAAPAADPEIRTLETQAIAAFTSVRHYVTLLAERMPEDGYSFKPTPEVRTFAAALGHLVQANVNQCSNLHGKKHALSGQDLTVSLATKDQVLKALADVYAFCDEYISALKSPALSERTFITAIVREGQRVPVKVPHGSMITSLVAHNNEMYGYLSMYLRLKGIVPPSSDPRR